MRILAIDPGPTQSGYAVIDSTTYQTDAFGKKENHTLREMIYGGQFSEVDYVAIEMIEGRGMSVGKDVFQTCVWVGRFLECAPTSDVDLVYRRLVKLHICGNANAKDSNITQALIDRFASGVRNRGKGLKGAPGWFYNFKADIWQAYALAVYTADVTAARDVTRVRAARTEVAPITHGASHSREAL